jgi:hypothetical protein
VGAGLGSFLILERNGELTFSGYVINTILVLSCLFALLYPFFEILQLFSIKCPFNSLTGLPCPGCGYTRSIISLLEGNISASFNHNPGWFILIIFLATLISIGLGSIIKGRQLGLSNGQFIFFLVLLVCTWIGNLILWH